METIILGAALKVGAPIIKGILSKYLPGTIPDTITKVVLETVAEKAGVQVDELSEVPQDQLESAVIQAEGEMPEVLVEHTKMFQASVDLMKAEMAQNEGFMSWGWRPMWMWFLMFAWGWTWIIVPTINGAFGVEMTTPMTTDLIWVSTLFAGFYMGGHAAQKLMGSWANARK